jgi:hypothetical protein
MLLPCGWQIIEYLIRDVVAVRNVEGSDVTIQHQANPGALKPGTHGRL